MLQVSGPLSVMEDKVNIYFYSLLLLPHLPLQIYCLKIQTLCAFLSLRPLLSLCSLYFLIYTLLTLCVLEVVALHFISLFLRHCNLTNIKLFCSGLLSFHYSQCFCFLLPLCTMCLYVIYECIQMLSSCACQPARPPASPNA